MKRINCLLVLIILLTGGSYAKENTQEITIKLDKALSSENPKVRDWVLSPVLHVVLLDDKVQSATIHLKRGWSVPSWKGVVESINITQSGDRLKGKCRAKISSENIVDGIFDINFEAKINDKAISGSYSSIAGDIKKTGNLRGSIESIPYKKIAPEDAVWTIHLAKALPDGKLLTLYMNRQNKSFKAFAFSPNYTRRPMDVDCSKLTLTGTKLKGSISVTRFNKSNDGTRFNFGTYEIDADLSDYKIKGTYKGKNDDKIIQDDVFGDIRRRKEIPQNLSMWVKCEDGYAGGEMWQNRVFFNWTQKNNIFDSGTADNNKNVFKATLTDAKSEFTSNTVKIKIRSTVLESSSVTKGDYTFQLEGLRSGDVIYGQFKTYLKGKYVQSGYFSGGIKR